MKYLRTFLLVMAKSTKFIKIFKSLKFLKVATSFISMAIFAVCYSAAMGITLAIAFTILLLIHELGHVYALRKRGHPLKLPLFIPFVGAVIFADRIKSRDEEAYIGMGGPLIGTMASLLAGVPYLFTGNKLWLVAAFLGIIINLFNMIPLSPLDGGRITQAISPWFRVIGFIMLLAITLAGKEPGMLLIWIAVIIDLESIKHGRRLKIASSIWVLMLIMTVCGVGNQPIANMVDTGLAACLVLPLIVLYFLGEESRATLDKEFQEQNQFKKEMVPCTNEQRVGWGLSWAGLVAFQVSAMVVLHPFIKPPPAKAEEISQREFRMVLTNEVVYLIPIQLEPVEK